MLVYASDPGGGLAPDAPRLLSPYTAALGRHLWNPGGGAHGAGGGYPMMLADVKSEVLRETGGRQCPWMAITRGADRAFCFLPEDAPLKRGRAGRGAHSRRTSLSNSHAPSAFPAATVASAATGPTAAAQVSKMLGGTTAARRGLPRPASAGARGRSGAL